MTEWAAQPGAHRRTYTTPAAGPTGRVSKGTYSLWTTKRR
jgi:hypothetical protein